MTAERKWQTVRSGEMGSGSGSGSGIGGSTIGVDAPGRWRLHGHGGCAELQSRPFRQIPHSELFPSALRGCLNVESPPARRMAASRTQPSSSTALTLDADADYPSRSAMPKGGKGKGKGKENATLDSTSTPGRASVGATELQGESEVLVDDEPWVWTTLADSSVSNRPALFTLDGSHFFSAVGNSVRIYSAFTGKVVSTLSSSSSGSCGSRVVPAGDGHTDNVTAVVLNPSNPYQIISASLDGSIKIWDYLEATLLQTISVGKPISHMCAHASLEGQVFVATLTKAERGGNSIINQEKGNTLIYRVSLKPSPTAIDFDTGASRSSSIVRVGKTRAAASLALSHNGAWLVAIGGFKAYVATTSSLESGFTKFVSPEKLTCLAFHPSDEYFATGDEKGQIRLWYCLNSQISFKSSNGAVGIERRAQTTTMHWHAHAVAAIAFTANGAYLVSGGEESVLVIWQLQSGKKEFVPRLGSPVKSIAIRQGTEEEYLMGLADGSYIFVGASSLSVKRSISRVRIDTTRNVVARSSIPFAFHNTTKTLILPASHPSSLQVFSPSTSVLISEVEVSPSNRVSKRDEKAIEPFRVEHVAVAPGGRWMATIDMRENEDDFSAEVYLKIWRWVSSSSSWVLNTRIDRPHGSGAVKSLAFSPAHDSLSGTLLMTAGLDGCVKTWRIRSSTSKNNDANDYWINRSSFSFRLEMPLDACWSIDGSLLAVAFERHITLFDPISSLQLDCLDTAEVKAPDRIRFVGQSSRYLMVFNNKDVVLWDLVTRSVRWYFRSPSYIIHAITHPRRDMIAILLHPYAEPGATRLTTVIVLGSDSPKPLALKSLPFRLRSLIWRSETPVADFSLFGITEAWNIVLFGENHLTEQATQLDYAAHRIDKSVGSVSTNRTLFSDMFGATAMDSIVIPSTPAATSGGAGQCGVQALSPLSTPAYLAPPIESLYSSLMDAFITRVSEVDTKNIISVDDQDEDDMVIDTDVPSAPSFQTRTVDDREVEMLTSIFRSQSINQRPQAVGRLTNGKPNGKHHIPHQNGTRPHTPRSTTALSNRDSVIPEETASPSAIAPVPSETVVSSPVAVGKKRKKSQA